MTRCGRCGVETNITTGSFFDTTIICMDCRTLEQKHPAYEAAHAAETAAVRHGDYNFPGVGLPSDWRDFVAQQKAGT